MLDQNYKSSPICASSSYCLRYCCIILVACQIAVSLDEEQQATLAQSLVESQAALFEKAQAVKKEAEQELEAASAMLASMGV